MKEIIDMYFTDDIIKEFNEKKGEHKKIYATMVFNKNKDDIWENTNNIISVNGEEALITLLRQNEYNHSAEIVDGESIDELKLNMIEKLSEYQNK